MMTEPSPEFRRDAFIQDITNLKSTLKTLGIRYQLKKVEIKIKDGEYGHIDIPEFPLHQFLGRVCMMLEELQSKFSLPANEGLVPCCKIHGKNTPIMCIEGHAYCMRCIAGGPFAEFECDWVDPEDA